MLPEEILRTAGRLEHASVHSKFHENSRLVVHHADLRIVPTAAEGQSSENQIKLGLPPALLRTLAGRSPAVLAESGSTVHSTGHAAASRRSGARLHLGEKFRRTSTEKLEQPGLVARAAARAAAAERLSIKHSALKVRGIIIFIQLFLLLSILLSE